MTYYYPPGAVTVPSGSIPDTPPGEIAPQLTRTQTATTLIGTAACLFTAPPGQKWSVGMVSVSTTSAVPTSATIYAAGTIPVCATAAGNGDNSAGAPPVELNGGETLTVQWVTPGSTSATNPYVASASVFYQEID